MSTPSPNLIPNRNDRTIEELICYQKAQTIYDLTYLFVERYLKKGDRTIDQMIQAARSGKQNIVEGYAAGATSAETELKLFNDGASRVQRQALLDLCRGAAHGQRRMSLT